MNASGNYFWNKGCLGAKSVHVGSGTAELRAEGLKAPLPPPNFKQKINNYIMTVAFLSFKVSKSSGEEFSETPVHIGTSGTCL